MKAEEHGFCLEVKKMARRVSTISNRHFHYTFALASTAAIVGVA
jgi:hypothetical protein